MIGYIFFGATEERVNCSTSFYLVRYKPHKKYVTNIIGVHLVHYMYIQYANYIANNESFENIHCLIKTKLSVQVEGIFSFTCLLLTADDCLVQLS